MDEIQATSTVGTLIRYHDGDSGEFVTSKVILRSSVKIKLQRDYPNSLTLPNPSGVEFLRTGKISTLKERTRNSSSFVYDGSIKGEIGQFRFTS